MARSPDEIMLTVMVPAELHARAKSKAALSHLSLRQAVEKALENWIAGDAERKYPASMNRTGRGEKSGAKFSIAPEYVPAVEAFIAWLETRPDTPDRAEVRAFMLKRMNCPDPLAEPVRRKNAG